MSAVSYFRMRVFSFSVSYAYFFLCCLVFVLPSFIHAESMHEFDLLAPSIIILSCCILMSELLFDLRFRCCFYQNQHVFCSKSMSFVAPEQKLLYGQFLLPDSVERVLEPGANFAKIFTPWSRLHWVLWLQSRSCFTAIFLIWLCQACVRTRGLISLKFSRPGLVYTVFCCSRAEVGIRQFLLPDSVELVLEPGA